MHAEKAIADAKRVIAFHLAETDQNLVAAGSFDARTLHQMSRDLYVTYRQLEEAPDTGRRTLLEGIAQFATAARQEAINRGARSRNDVLWNTASLIESITHIELLKMDGLDPDGGAAGMKDRLDELIARHLTDEDRHEIDKVVAANKA
jgi:hypothetical protein